MQREYCQPRESTEVGAVPRVDAWILHVCPVDRMHAPFASTKICKATLSARMRTSLFASRDKAKSVTFPLPSSSTSRAVSQTEICVSSVAC